MAKASKRITPPIPTSTLWGTSVGVGQSDGQMVRKSNLWRDNYNPLVGLTMRRLTVLFEMAERGAYVELQLLLRKVEKRYPVMKGFIERLLSTVGELDWDVKPLKVLPPGATPAMAEAQRQWLRARYDLIENLDEAIGQICLAEIRGYAILQKHRYEDGPNDGAVRELYWLEPWVWSREGYYGDFYYNEISRFGVGLGSCVSTLGEANRIGSAQMPREEFVIREVESPLYEIGCIAFMNWLMANKDWAAFVEIFGLAKGVVIMPPNIPPGKEADYQAAAEKVSDGVSGALPNASDIKFPTAGVRGESPFKLYRDAQNEDFVMAATSGILSMLTHGGGGLNQGPHKEHGDVWEKIGKMKGKAVNLTLRRDFDVLELAAQFPGQPVCVQFTLAVQDDEDVNTVADTVVKLEGVGLQTDAKEISERTGYKLTRVALPAGGGADPAQMADQRPDKKVLSQAIMNRALPAGSTTDIDQFAAGVADDLSHILARLQAISEIKDDAVFEAKLKQFHADFPQLKADILKDPSAQRHLLPIITKSFIEGLIGKTPVAKS